MHVCSVAVITKLSNISRDVSESVSEKSDRLQGTNVSLRDKLFGRYECPEVRQGHERERHKSNRRSQSTSYKKRKGGGVCDG